MGFASEWMIEIHNAEMQDAKYAADYYNRAADEAEEEAIWLLGLENEKMQDWFPDRMFDYKGKQVLLPEEIEILIDDDLPF